MKPIKYIALFGFFLARDILGLKVLPTTPKAGDLTDHFGTEPGNNVFGPKTTVVGRLAREGITSDATPVTPITNFGEEIKSNEVVAGDLDNVAYDASRIVKAEIAAAKFDIKSDFVHEAIIKTPVHIGNQYSEKTTESMNRVTGEVTKRTEQVTKPIVEMINNVREVKTHHETLVDVKTGKIIEPLKVPEFHGEK